MFLHFILLLADSVRGSAAAGPLVLLLPFAFRVLLVVTVGIR